MRLVATDSRNPPPTSMATRHVMRANRPSSTSAEIRFGDALKSVGISGYSRNLSTPAGRIDICFRRELVAVLVHGCFWHRCRVCQLPIPKSHREFWLAKFRRNRARDRRQKLTLEGLGWRVEEVWEHEIEQNALPRARRIGRVIASRRSRQRKLLPIRKRGGQ
jgi:DNA mismatch endonuclease (patch repair protein)